MNRNVQSTSFNANGSGIGHGGDNLVNYRGNAGFAGNYVPSAYGQQAYQTTFGQGGFGDIQDQPFGSGFVQGYVPNPYQQTYHTGFGQHQAGFSDQHPFGPSFPMAASSVDAIQRDPASQ